MRNALRPLSAAELSARTELRQAHARLTEITKALRIPLDTYLEIHSLARKIENASATARAEMIHGLRAECEAIAERATLRPTCDVCGNHGSIGGVDANGSFVEPCIRCA